MGYGIGIVELIVGTAPNEPFIRFCGLPGPSFIIYYGLICLLASVLSARDSQAPSRLSSVPKGAPVRPITFRIIEDVIAVDTSTGRRYREALNARYEASARFRKMLAEVDLLWGLGAVSVGVATTLAMYIPHIRGSAAYGIDWAVPPVWAMTWAPTMTLLVQRTLRIEKTE